MGFGKDGKGVIIREQTQIALATLAVNTAIKATALVMAEDFRMLKSEVFAVVDGITDTEGEGLLIGLADNELSVAEIGECIGINGPLHGNDRVKQEKAERAVWLIGQSLISHKSGTTGVFHGKGGQHIEVKPRWTFGKGDLDGSGSGWCWFVYNGSDAQLSTGATVKFKAKSYGVWVR